MKKQIFDIIVIINRSFVNISVILQFTWKIS